MTALKCSLYVTAATLAACTSSYATQIFPGITVVPSLVTPAQNGSTLASASGTITAKTFTASYSESVFYDAASPYTALCGSQCLTFVLQVSNASGSQNGIEHVTYGDGSGNFALYETSVGYEAGAGQDPMTADESLPGTMSFDYVGMNALLPGSGTAELVIETSATQLTDGFLSAIDSSTGTVPGFVPAVPTPEPGSIALLGTGLLGMGAALRRRATQNSRLG